MNLSAYLAAAPSSEFFWWSAVPWAVAAAAFVASFVFVRRTRLIEDTPTSRLRSAAQGYVEVEGMARVMDGPPIICPLTATRCVWWRYKVERKETSTDSRGNRRTSWVRIDYGRSDDCFLLDDGTGTCVVDPDGADVIPTTLRRWYGYAPRPDVGPEQGRGFWRAAFCTYRYTEELIFPVNQVYVIGSYRTQAGGPDSFDEQADMREKLAAWKKDKQKMAVFDVNKDGTVDAKEWEAARRIARAQVRKEHVERAVATTDLNIMARPRDGRPYILSGIPQAALVRRYRAFAFSCLLGMTASMGVAMWVLRARGLL
jgi:hypothetical protein